MVSRDRQVNLRVVAIARFSKFIGKYTGVINWTLVAQASGVIDILDKPKHERVRRAQHFGDSDYPSAVSFFIGDVFSTDEEAGKLLVNEILEDMGGEFTPEAIAELEQILKMFGGNEPDKNYLISNLPSITSESLLDITEIPDDFYKKLIEEINKLYRHGFALSLSVLIRKLLENLIIDILRKRFGTQDLSLYYDTARRRFQDFSVLIKNLELRQVDFQHITSNLDSKIISEINLYRETGNSGAHSIDANMKIEHFKDKRDDLNYLVQFLFRLLKNISP